jgi:hypothetical protein
MTCLRSHMFYLPFSAGVTLPVGAVHALFRVHSLSRNQVVVVVVDGVVLATECVVCK